MSLLNEGEVKEIAEKVFEGNKIELLNYSLGNKSEQAIGYLGNHLNLTLNVLVNGSKVEKVLFVKTYQVKEGGEDFIGKTGIFVKEVDLYKVLVEDVKNLVGEPKWCPKYYYSKDKALVLEDLSERGYKMSGKTSLSKAQITTALKTLSSLHASSFLLEDLKSKPLNEIYPNIFKEILYDENNLEAPSRKWVSWQTQDLIVGIDLLNMYTEEQKKVIKSRFVDQINRIYPLSKPSQRYRNVLTHGDLWRNNLMFKYSEKTPIDCVFVDYQFSRYAPPAHDVMHLLHYATTKAIRDEQELNFLKIYYESLTKTLKSRGKDMQEDLPWEEFVKSCKEYKELALVQSLLSLHYLLGPTNLRLDPKTYEKYEEYMNNNRHEYMRCFFRIDWYYDKISDILCELIDGYIIKK